MSSSIVLPGQRLGSVKEYCSGNGTYVREQHIYASLTGQKSILCQKQRVVTNDGQENSNSTASSSLPVMQVTSKFGTPMTELVLQLNDIVTGKITRITQRHAEVEILTVRGIVLPESVSGIIRKEDVRLTDIDSVQIEKFFKPGQVVKAAVRSFGDTRAYYLTTARSDLGIITPQKS